MATTKVTITLDDHQLVDIRKLVATGTTDIVDAHVVICARRQAQSIVTSEPADLKRLDPSARLIAV